MTEVLFPGVVGMVTAPPVIADAPPLIVFISPVAPGDEGVPATLPVIGGICPAGPPGMGGAIEIPVVGPIGVITPPGVVANPDGGVLFMGAGREPCAGNPEAPGAGAIPTTPGGIGAVDPMAGTVPIIGTLPGAGAIPIPGGGTGSPGWTPGGSGIVIPGPTTVPVVSIGAATSPKVATSTVKAMGESV
jgi:hypothetical protein